MPESEPGQLSSTAFAIAADALPAPITSVRPFGGAGRCGGRQRAGCAARIAASNIARSRSRGGVIGEVASARGWRLSDLEVGELFERADQRRMVECREAVRGAGIEELLRSRRVR